MSFKITSNARAYAGNLRKYAADTGKEISDAVAREGPDFRRELFNQFRLIHPSGQGILNAAKARGFRVRRNAASFLVKTENGLDARAINRAKELLDGKKSDLFRPLFNDLVPVRFSSRKGNRRLQGGRYGYRFAASALRAYQLSPDQLRASLAEDAKIGTGIKRLNLRALAVYLELLYRKRASQGGTMAVQWLFKTYKWSSRGSFKTSKIIQRSVTNLPIGTIDFETDIIGNLQTIVFNGYVPGTGLEAEKHGIMDKVYSARSNRLLIAIQLHHDKVARLAALQ